MQRQSHVVTAKSLKGHNQSSNFCFERVKARAEEENSAAAAPSRPMGTLRICETSADWSTDWTAVWSYSSGCAVLKWSQGPITVENRQWQQGTTAAWSDGRFSTVAVVAVDSYSLRQRCLQRLHSVVVLHSQWALQPLAGVDAPGATVLSQLVEATQTCPVGHAYAEWLPVSEGADLPVVAAISHLLVTWDRGGSVSEGNQWKQLDTIQRNESFRWFCFGLAVAN